MALPDYNPFLLRSVHRVSFLYSECVKESLEIPQCHIHSVLSQRVHVKSCKTGLLLICNIHRPDIRIGKIEPLLGSETVYIGRPRFSERVLQRSICNTQAALIGYPDKWKDYSTLIINPTLPYMENVRNIRRWEMAENFSRLAKPVDRTEWLMSPQTVNAYYNPATNEICFPAAILQPPFFNPEADDAVNYGARAEITRAVNKFITENPGKKISENDISQNLYTAGQPDPDLIIRTGGEMRLSNFLLWQASYSEYYSTPVLWPDFDEKCLDEAILEYNKRTRKFGGLSS